MNDTTSVRNALGSNSCCCRQRMYGSPLSFYSTRSP
jgi:hypothetical protein